ncbi:TPA: N-acetylneuraminate epimerase [Aeromonas sobria]|nr:N-acetylneuraminate epimerase [Aeromonas sobria]
MIKKISIAALVVVSSGSYASVLPETPVPFKNGAGVIDKNNIYIGLGSAGSSWYKLDAQAKEKKWIALADFPGGPREQATAAFIGGNIYVFGGIGKNRDGLTQVFNDVHMYQPKTNHWVKLMSHSPLGMAGHVTVVHNDKVFMTGGVNQNVFNGYFDDLNTAGNDKNIVARVTSNYFDKKTEDYFFSKALLAFDPSSLQWSFVGESPWFGTAGSSAVNDSNKIYIINGEVKPGLRTDAVFQLDFSGKDVKWNKIPSVSSPDGVAGGFAAMSYGNIVFAGGAGFKGSRRNYNNGKNYAHEGIKKFYSSDIHVWHDGKWHTSGTLPEGRAYGLSLPWQNGLLILGGETVGGKVLADSILLTADKNELKIE